MIPRHRFALLPTAVESLPRLSEELGGIRILVKRDDQTGLAFGGNKTRKLEFLLGEALAQGAHTLITAGAAQSNHCRQTAAAAARFGFECVLVLVGEPPKSATANLMIDHLLGVQLVWVPRREDRERVLQETFDRVAADGKKPYLVPYGGSNAIGALGYVYAMEELIAQKVQPEWVVFASSSGGTQAGLTLGARLFGFKGRVLGISVDEPQKVLQERVARLANETADLLGKPQKFDPVGVLINADYCAAGYGVLTDAERAAVRLFARTEGLLLDPVYTGRAAAGLVDLVRKGFFKPGETVLFWNTGGQPALFAEKYADLI
jgi:D-cysteine desulfhydrase